MHEALTHSVVSSCRHRCGKPKQNYRNFSAIPVCGVSVRSVTSIKIELPTHNSYISPFGKINFKLHCKLIRGLDYGIGKVEKDLTSCKW